MRLSLALLVLAASPAAAAPSASRIDGEAAARGISADDAFNNEGNGEDGCWPDCKTELVARFLVPRGAGEVQVRRAKNNEQNENLHRVVLRDGKGAWFAWDIGGLEASSDCGMGRCVSERVQKVTFDRDGDIVWIRLRVRTGNTHGDPARRKDDRWFHRDIVVACKTTTMSCASTAPESLATSTAEIHGMTVTTRTTSRLYADGTEPAEETVTLAP